MKKLDSLTSDAKQVLKIPTTNGSIITLTLEFIASQRGWFYSVDYPGFTGLSKRRLVNSPNMLRQFRGVLPFGLACYVTDGQEPVFVDDFTNDRVKIYILDGADDILLMEGVIAS